MTQAPWAQAALGILETERANGSKQAEAMAAVEKAWADADAEWQRAWKEARDAWSKSNTREEAAKVLLRLQSRPDLIKVLTDLVKEGQGRQLTKPEATALARRHLFRPPGGLTARGRDAGLLALEITRSLAPPPRRKLVIRYMRRVKSGGEG